MFVDGFFFNGEKKILYCIDNAKVKIEEHKHVEWMSRGISYMDENGNHLGYRAIYHPAAEVTIFPQKAKEWYLELVGNASNQ